MSTNDSSGDALKSGSEDSPKGPPNAPKKVLKGPEWRKRKRASLARKSGTESSESEPEVKKTQKGGQVDRKGRKAAAAMKKFFQMKGNGGKKKGHVHGFEKDTNYDSDYYPSNDSGTESDQNIPDDWSAEEKEEEVTRDSLEEEEEEEEGTDGWQWKRWKWAV